MTARPPATPDETHLCERGTVLCLLSHEPKPPSEALCKCLRRPENAKVPLHTADTHVEVTARHNLGHEAVDHLLNNIGVEPRTEDCPNCLVPGPVGQHYDGQAYGCDPSRTISRQMYRDRHGDRWTEGADGLYYSRETRPFSLEHVEKKWGPLTDLGTAPWHDYPTGQ